MDRCQNCDDLYREVADLADQCAFWAYQAKWYFARANRLGCYDDLTAKQ